MKISAKLKLELRKNWNNRNNLIPHLVSETKLEFHRKNDFEHNFMGTMVAKEEQLIAPVTLLCFKLGETKTPDEFFKEAEKIQL